MGPQSWKFLRSLLQQGSLRLGRWPFPVQTPGRRAANCFAQAFKQTDVDVRRPSHGRPGVVVCGTICRIAMVIIKNRTRAMVYITSTHHINTHGSTPTRHNYSQKTGLICSAEVYSRASTTGKVPVLANRIRRLILQAPSFGADCLNPKNQTCSPRPATPNQRLAAPWKTCTAKPEIPNQKSKATKKPLLLAELPCELR